MGRNNGRILGTSKIVDHGAASRKLNFVMLGDGYTASEMAQYRSDVDEFVTGFRTRAPLDRLWCGVNFYRVDVESDQTGPDNPACNGVGNDDVSNTFFDSTFCGDGTIHRLLTANNELALEVARDAVPEVHMTFVLVNTAIRGGAGGSVAVFSKSADWIDVAVHEMGHTLFNLADEYPYWAGCGDDGSDRDNYSGGEPVEPNVTVNTNRNTLKWRNMVLASTGLPTMSNPDSTQCDNRASTVDARTVGLFEGAQYFHAGIYRAEHQCKMRESSAGFFCAVCEQEIVERITPFLGPDTITLVTPSISFNNIPEGLGGVGVTTYRAIVFEVGSCRPTTFQIISGPTGGFGTPLGFSDTITPNNFDPVGIARLWISYTSTTPGSTASGIVTVRCVESGDEYEINISANTVARPRSAVAFVFDHSGSMEDEAGDGTKKVQKLRTAANIFVNLMLPGDGIGIARFDDTADGLMIVKDVGLVGIGSGRIEAAGVISGPQLDPAGGTSIGAGVVKGKELLDGVSGYDYESLLVFTDGMENVAPMLSNIAASINSRTFAIGLGMPSNISVASLQSLTRGNNGYLIVTGEINQDQATRLSKYFLQILTDVTNANIILDPHLEITPGVLHRIPFSVTEADIAIDVILLCENPKYLQWALETPSGEIITMDSANLEPNIEYYQSNEMAFYRASLPALPANTNGSHGGTWNILLKTIDKFKNTRSNHLGSKKIPYDVMVHTYSNLNFEAILSQTRHDIGEKVLLHAILKEYDVLIERRAKVWVEITSPDGNMFNVNLTESRPGEFDGSFIGAVNGVYTCRFRAKGRTFKGTDFTREKTLTAFFASSNTNPSNDSLNNQDNLCKLLRCILSKGIDDRRRKQLIADGYDIDSILKCLEISCNVGSKDKLR